METNYKKAKKYLCEAAKDIKEKYKTDKPAQRMYIKFQFYISLIKSNAELGIDGEEQYFNSTLV